MPDGARLPFKAWIPEEQAKAVIVAIHGFGDYSKNAFEIPSPLFLSRDVAIYAYDQRGFGAGPDRGYWHDSKTIAGDAINVVRIIKESHPSTPIFLLGESMGAAVALLAAEQPGASLVQGYILMAPGIRGRATMSGFAKWLLEVVAHSIPIVGFRGSAPGFSPTDNEDAMRRWSSDPLTTKEFRVDAVYGLVNLMDAALAAARNFRGRVLVLYGGHDRIVPASAVRSFLRVLPATRIRRFGFYPSGYHLLLRDRQRSVVANDIVEWIFSPDRPLPSGAEQAGLEWLRQGGD
ncbi:alpha/beta hydrolase [Siccirubricoccus sp. KC 17139]|uniref:Alpha/beta hydrolase n=1 Tax=Siccirubricoccus soli TaxID=2899147 RepID=A0ABT1D7V3_9PROT|nr:alpha/beta fold hydrolase [Siccirubricoccus soli]MCO6417991.1 alpha/beta hydrolase [Siccirubricoccus soli]MCP2684126.1 lysophospholipase [Siccirubricoccus soli]